jgi:hypothetical protein
VQAAPPLAAEAAGGAQQTEPESAGGGKKEKERLRKMEEALEALGVAMALMEETTGARGVDAVEEAMQAAEKHEARSEPLAALLVVARDLVEQARAEEAERARVASEAAAAAAEEAAAAEQHQLVAELAALILSVQSDAMRLRSDARRVQSDRLRVQSDEMRLQSDARRVQSDRLRVQQMQAQLSVPPTAPAPHPDAEETLCVVCLDAPKSRVVLPCMHMCVCEACAQLLRDRCRCAAGPMNGIIES